MKKRNSGSGVNAIPVASFIDGLEPAARSVCRMVGLVPDQVYAGPDTVAGAVSYEAWKIVASAMATEFVICMPSAVRPAGWVAK